MNAVAPRLPALIGGSADLNPSTFTMLEGAGDFESAAMGDCDRQGGVGGVWSYSGRNLVFGVREHGMGAILNGLALAKLRAAHPKDGLYALYEERIAEFRASPPPAGWNGVTVFHAK